MGWRKHNRLHMPQEERATGAEESTFWPSLGVQTHSELPKQSPLKPGRSYRCIYSCNVCVYIYTCVYIYIYVYVYIYINIYLHNSPLTLDPQQQRPLLLAFSQPHRYSTIPAAWETMRLLRSLAGLNQVMIPVRCQGSWWWMDPRGYWKVGGLILQNWWRKCCGIR